MQIYGGIKRRKIFQAVAASRRALLTDNRASSTSLAAAMLDNLSDCDKLKFLVRIGPRTGARREVTGLSLTSRVPKYSGWERKRGL